MNKRSHCHDEIPKEGLTILVDPPSPTLDIVFVHGFTGDPVRTWTHKKGAVCGSDADQDEIQPSSSKSRRLYPFMRSHHNQNESSMPIYWPQYLLPQALPSARILTYGYDTHIKHWLGQRVNRNTVYDIAWDFLVSLEAKRRADPSRPLIFVVHSLGGIVVKEMLRRSSGCNLVQNHLHDVFTSTIGIMFFGTPHGGADPRRLLQHIAETVIKTMGWSPNDQIVDTLLPSSERLKELRDEFSPMAQAQKWTIHSFQESLGVGALSGRKVVEDTSSCLNVRDIEVTEHIGRNHMDMCRFTGFEDVEYKKVLAALQRLAGTLLDKSESTSRSALSSEQKQRLLESLSFTQIDARHMTIKKAHAKTCKWLLNNSRYTDWLDPGKIGEHRGFLWVKGKPGAGKSTLMKFVLADSRTKMKDRIVLAFFFNARGDDLEKSTAGMYRSLLFQLLMQIPELQNVFDSLSTSNSSAIHQWSIELLKELFEQAIHGLGDSSVICFIDALDECDEREIRDMVSFFEHIGDLAVTVGRQFRVCFSSRHYPHITFTMGLDLVLERQEGHGQDITNYLTCELRIGHSKDAELIRSELQEKAFGVFMWVVLVVEILNKEYDRGRIHALRKRLRDIPDDLHELFRDILTRDSQNKDELLLCIQWILFTRTPLKPEQIYFAILAGTEPEFLSAWDPESITMEIIKRRLLDSSKGVAEITKSKNPTVQFIHESVRDFLLKDDGLQKIWPELEERFQGQSHNRLKECCMTCLGLDISAHVDLNQSLSKTSSRHAAQLRMSLTQAFPFLEYAVQNLLHHANLAEDGGASQAEFIKDFQLVDWIKLDNVFEKFATRRHRRKTKLLYILAEKNMPNLIRIHPEKLNYLDNEKQRYGPPLLAALVTGSKDAVQAFMEAQAALESPPGQLHELYREYCNEDQAPKRNRNFRFSSHQDVMLALARRADDILLAFLLIAGSSATASKDTKYWESLMIEADRNCCNRSIKLLLSNSCANGSHARLKRLPQPAVEGGEENVVRMLGDKSHLILTKGGYESVLQQASELGHEQTVKLLLSNGADIIGHPHGGIHERTLVAACEKGHEQIVELFLAAGANVNAPGRNDNTALQAAASAGAEKIVVLLLDKGADVHKQGGLYGNALQAAASARAERIVVLLLGKGADVHQQGGFYGNALQAAATEDSSEIVKLLLSKGADVNAQGGEYGNALQAAAINQSSKNVKLLLSKGADVNAQGGDYGSALQAAAVQNSSEIVKLLLSKGADVNAQGGYYGNALQAAVFKNSSEIVKLLLSKDADVNAQGGHFGNALQAASRDGNEQIVELLIEKGADINAQGGHYSNALHAASWGNKPRIIELLRSKGAIE